MNITTCLTRALVFVATAVLITACAESAAAPDDTADGDTSCKRAGDAFESYVAEHQSCEHDEDCEVIGDCGPNADFRSVRAEAATDAYSLMRARCMATYDGPGFSPRCVAGRCGMEEDRDLCCNCFHEEDAGR